MSKCADCSNPAVVHSVIVVDGAEQEIHLCRPCAEKRKLIAGAEPLHLPVAAAQSMGSVSLVSQDLSKLQCPECGMKYMDFRRLGRLGCPHDYVVFRAGLEPLLERVQRSSRHTGKRPSRGAGGLEPGAESRRLRQQLRRAILAEDYEGAAKLRDAIRAKGHAHGS
jgi:protein arginine kinase activator